MKLRIALVFLVLIASVSLFSCIITSRAIDVEISCDEFTENPHSIINEFQAEIGVKITVKLCSNPSTGFQWDYDITIAGVLKEEDHDFEEPKEAIPGAPSVESWTFEAVEEGTTEVRFAYNQPWEGGEKETWTYTMTVTVE
ncbi:protease inhibitor I42 family protein [Chloroflexota bacterium]